MSFEAKVANHRAILAAGSYRKLRGALKGSERLSFLPRHASEASVQQLLSARDFPWPKVIRLSCPDILAPRNHIENAVPTSSRVKDGHAEHEHPVVRPPLRAKRLPRFRGVCIPKVGCFHL